MLCHAQETKLKARQPRLSRSSLVEVVLMEMLLLGMLLRSLLMLQMHPISRVAVLGVLSRKLSTQRPSALAYACQLLGELDGGVCQQVRQHETNMQAPLTILTLRFWLVRRCPATSWAENCIALQIIADCCSVHDYCWQLKTCMHERIF